MCAIVPDILPNISDCTEWYLQDCVCLVALFPSREEPLAEFNVMQDFNITGGGGGGGMLGHN